MVEKFRDIIRHIAASRQRSRYERLRRKALRIQSRIVDDLERELRKTQTELQEAQIAIRMLRKTVEQQEWVINRDRERVMQEIRDLGGNLARGERPNESA